MCLGLNTGFKFYARFLFYSWQLWFVYIFLLVKIMGGELQQISHLFHVSSGNVRKPVEASWKTSNRNLSELLDISKSTPQRITL